MRRVAVLFLALLAARSARAGNLDAVFVSDEAAMMGGAVTAISADCGATFYNPAGLALDTSYSSISLSASTYAFALRSRQLLEAAPEVGGTVDDLSTLQVVTVPAAVASYFPINEDIGVGFGLFAPSAANEWQRNAIDIEDGGNTFRLTFEERVQASQLYIGGGVGVRVSDTLRLGGSLFGLYSVQSAHLDLAGDETFSDGSQDGLVLSQNSEGYSLGLRAVGGLQWEPLPGWMIGATVQLPTLELVSETSLSSALALVDADSDPFLASPFSRDSTGLGASLAVRALAGIGYRGELTRFGAEASYQRGDRNNSLSSDVWNARVGFGRRLNDYIMAGAGAFTDRSSQRADDEMLGASSLDYYGFTVGLRGETHYLARIVGDYIGAEAEEEQTRLVFFTALAGRYAYGTGTGSSLSFGANRAGELDAVNASRELVVHEFSGTLSTGVIF